MNQSAEYSHDPLINSAEVRRVFGDISHTTLWRWERDNVLPQPTRIRNRKYWRRSEIIALSDSCVPGSMDPIAGKRDPKPH